MGDLGAVISSVAMNGSAPPHGSATSKDASCQLTRLLRKNENEEDSEGSEDTSHISADTSHISALCEKCQELGHSCIKL